MNQEAARDATRTIGLRIRRRRESRNKSLRVLSGLAGMSTSPCTASSANSVNWSLSEIVALTSALRVAPAELIKLPIRAPANDTSERVARADSLLRPR